MKNKKPAPTGRPGANLSVDSYSLMGDSYSLMGDSYSLMGDAWVSRIGAVGGRL